MILDKTSWFKFRFLEKLHDFKENINWEVSFGRVCYISRKNTGLHTTKRWKDVFLNYTFTILDIGAVTRILNFILSNIVENHMGKAKR
jgi:hypothetical protein